MYIFITWVKFITSPFKNRLKLALFIYLSLLLKLKKSDVKIIDEAFESAVHQYTSCETNKKLWLAYIKHRLKNLSTMKIVPAEHYQNFVDLFTRCLMSVPARTVVARNKNVHWIDYSFHNKVSVTNFLYKLSGKLFAA